MSFVVFHIGRRFYPTVAGWSAKKVGNVAVPFLQGERIGWWRTRNKRSMSVCSDLFNSRYVQKEKSDVVTQKRKKWAEDEDALGKDNSATSCIAKSVPDAERIPGSDEINVENRCDNNQQECDGGRNKKGDKSRVIPPSNAVIDPLAVMVAVIDAVVTQFTMARPRCSIGLASRTIFDPHGS